jgi:acetyl/propionyl-CoA carboxylase alpha subunit
MRWIEVEFQGHKVRVPALKAQGRLWFHWRGENYVVEATGATRRSGAEKSTGKAGVITAPMPGKVTRVAVQAGDKVEKGQALVVMEAMKMEYTLEADRDGKVEEVGAHAGKQVALGEVLVRLGDA